MLTKKAGQLQGYACRLTRILVLSSLLKLAFSFSPHPLTTLREGAAHARRRTVVSHLPSAKIPGHSTLQLRSQRCTVSHARSFYPAPLSSIRGSSLRMAADKESENDEFRRKLRGAVGDMQQNLKNSAVNIAATAAINGGPDAFASYLSEIIAGLSSVFTFDVRCPGLTQRARGEAGERGAVVCAVGHRRAGRESSARSVAEAAPERGRGGLHGWKQGIIGCGERPRREQQVCSSSPPRNRRGENIFPVSLYREFCLLDFFALYRAKQLLRQAWYSRRICWYSEEKGVAAARVARFLSGIPAYARATSSPVWPAGARY
eukprot:3695437-Rhodomonas_salina.3